MWSSFSASVVPSVAPPGVPVLESVELRAHVRHVLAAEHEAEQAARARSAPPALPEGVLSTLAGALGELLSAEAAGSAPPSGSTPVARAQLLGWPGHRLWMVSAAAEGRSSGAATFGVDGTGALWQVRSHPGRWRLITACGSCLLVAAFHRLWAGVTFVGGVHPYPSHDQHLLQWVMTLVTAAVALAFGSLLLDTAAPGLVRRVRQSARRLDPESLPPATQHELAASLSAAVRAGLERARARTRARHEAAAQCARAAASRPWERPLAELAALRRPPPPAAA